MKTELQFDIEVGELLPVLKAHYARFDLDWLTAPERMIWAMNRLFLAIHAENERTALLVAGADLLRMELLERKAN